MLFKWVQWLQTIEQFVCRMNCARCSSLSLIKLHQERRFQEQTEQLSFVRMNGQRINERDSRLLKEREAALKWGKVRGSRIIGQPSRLFKGTFDWPHRRVDPRLQFYLSGSRVLHCTFLYQALITIHQKIKRSERSFVLVHRWTTLTMIKNLFRLVYRNNRRYWCLFSYWKDFVRETPNNTQETFPDEEPVNSGWSCFFFFHK